MSYMNRCRGGKATEAISDLATASSSNAVVIRAFPTSGTRSDKPATAAAISVDDARAAAAAAKDAAAEAAAEAAASADAEAATAAATVDADDDSDCTTDFSSAT